jgi:hypothetical protein
MKDPQNYEIVYLDEAKEHSEVLEVAYAKA